MAWTHTITGKENSGDRIRILVDYTDGATVLHDGVYVTSPSSDLDWLKAQIAQKISQLDALSAFADSVDTGPLDLTLPDPPTPPTPALPIVIVSKPTDARATIISHDFTNKTTWYEGSTYVADEVATDSGNHLTYTLAHAGVIDTYHGNLTDEDYLKDSSNRSYRVTVSVNGTSKTERDPHTGSGGDYTIDYLAGTVTFLNALDPADVVTVTYHYATTSTFTVKPTAGKVMTLSMAEVQIAMDVQPTDSAVFQAYGYVQSFAPQLTPSPYPANTLIPLGAPSIYKGVKDFINASVRSYVKYPALGTGWRGLPVDVVVYDWDYIASTVLDSSKGLEIRVSLQHHLPWTGSYGTVTLYGSLK